MVEQKQMARIRDAYARAGKGVCVKCGIPVVTQVVWPRCDKCNQEEADRAAARKLPGQCSGTHCTSPCRPGKKLCQHCCDRARNWYLGKDPVEQEKMKLAAKVKRRQRSQAKFLNGICVGDGCYEPHQLEKRYCSKCLEKKRKRTRQ